MVFKQPAVTAYSAKILIRPKALSVIPKHPCY